MRAVYELVVEEEFSAAHQLRQLPRQPEPLHGHNWRVQVAVAADDLDEHGMVMDFTRLREQVRAEVAPLAQRFLNEVPPFTTLEPSAENVAKWLHERVTARVNSSRIRVSRVMVWESSTAGATYST